MKVANEDERIKQKMGSSIDRVDSKGKIKWQC